jgi:LuxR family maltose regulon positive regulatory protein
MNDVIVEVISCCPTCGQPTSLRPPPGSALVLWPLSSRETDVIVLLAEYMSTEEIAVTLDISINTVRTHIRSIMRKLSVRNRRDAARRYKVLMNGEGELNG